ncbi:anhydro-N-acetylmuramic acid kinase [Motiliproteus sp. MSK22-1]|uniref:anhydro-N-acetylmuramic acid kinase n=1 Tax=Motiliproteus sp. MSK22-1 TaxID=1897630 RepID=UPI0009768437|nr:anhydro-N-acetylmuramic acid kinase [Motiliproteus sp. MSK22-1]OMH32195.1 anhydro-N-acetylmuramic acid kinase [Motiliproteus sp. MSK22-1]
MDSNLFIGLMSGTSLDGIDAVVVDLSNNFPKLVSSHLEPFPTQLRSELTALTQPGNNEIDRMGCTDIRFAELQVRAIQQLLKKAQLDPQSINAVGSHGQTIRHRPEGDYPFTLQIGDPNTIAEQTGIRVVADFRRRDMAAGGQGAPLVPAFHEYYLKSQESNRIILNIGGISNVTLLEKDINKSTLGYDTGPGNVLMDAWIERHQNQGFDKNGEWASCGNVDQRLLSLMLKTQYLNLTPPKSTGRELFHIGWLDHVLQSLATPIAAADVQATLLEFTATTIGNAIQSHQLEPLELFVCGGGARNQTLMKRLTQILDPTPVITTDSVGLPCEWLEAMAFAWLAKACLDGTCSNLPAVTGANGHRVLGGIYQA